MAIPKRPLVPAGNAHTSIDAIAVERLRCMTIVESAEGLARPAAARRLAFYSDMPADAAVQFLAEMPAEATAADRMSASFLRIMDASTDALSIAPMLAGNAEITGDRKSARLAELKQAAQATAVAKGYRSGEGA